MQSVLTVPSMRMGYVNAKEIESRSVLQGERGNALFATFLALLLLFALGSAGLLYSTIDLRGSMHYRTGNSALMAAESGVLHALATINGKLVFDFEEDIVDAWDEDDNALLGSNRFTLLNEAQSGYRVAAAGLPAEMRPLTANAAQNEGLLTAEGWSALQARRSVSVRLMRSALAGSPGAIFMASDGSIDLTMSSNAAFINGNDDTAGTGISTPGVSTRTEEGADSVIGGIARPDNVQGLGYDAGPPATPSVMATDGPSNADVDDIVDRILNSIPTCPAAAPATNCIIEISGQSFNDSHPACGISTAENPAIFHFTDSSPRINGNCIAYGLIIADGGLDFTGTVEFSGLIVVRGEGSQSIGGNGTVRGSIWTRSSSLTVRGNLTAQYSTQALQYADRAGLGGALGGNIPRRMVVVSWYEN